MDKDSLQDTFGVTAEQLDAWADEYEKGTWSGPLGKKIMGRPSLATEEVRPVTFRLPISKIASLDQKAASIGQTRSEYLRSVLDEALLAV